MQDFGITGDGDVTDAMADVLARYEWDCFCTLTFNRPRHDPFEARKVIDFWLFRWMEQEAIRRDLVAVERQVMRDGYGREIGVEVRRSGPWWRKWRKRKNRPVYVLGIERHRSGCVHMHLVLRLPDFCRDARRSIGWHCWHGPKSEGGMDLGRARIEPPKSQADVRLYCCKYVAKEAQEEGLLFLSDSFDAARITPPSV